MNKKQIIEKIKEIIEQHDIFTVADIQASSSPIISSFGKDSFVLAECFNRVSVEAISYVHEMEVSREDIAYEDLPKDTLEQILELAKEFEKMQ